MMWQSKKRITTDLLHLALILTLLHNGVFYPEDFQYDLNDDVTNSTRPQNQGIYNEFTITDGIVGSTYYSSRTSAYHQPPDSNYAIPHLSVKELEDPPEESLINETSHWILDDGAYYRERILEELRRLSVRRYSQLPREVSKGALTFQNVTAYIFNGTNDDHVQGFTSTIPELQTNPSAFESNPSRTPFHSVVVEENRRVTNNSENETPFSSPTDDLDSFLLQEIEDISLNYKDGIAFQDLFAQDFRPQDISVLEELHTQLNTDDEGDESLNSSNTNELDLSNFNLELPRLDERSSNLTQPEGQVTHDILSLNELLVLTDELETVDGIEGATALPTDWSNNVFSNSIGRFGRNDEFERWDFNQGLFFSDATIQREKRFDEDDITDEDLMNVIPPLALHGFDETEASGEVMSSSGSTTVSKIDRTRGISSCAGSISSNEEDILNLDELDPMDVDRNSAESALDELWETDSGIFDSVLDSPGLFDTDEEVLRTSESYSHDSSNINCGESELNGDFSSEESRDVEDSLSSEEMLQTAPFHSGVRPTANSAQPRSFQVHARMTGQMRGNSVDQRWQELASLLSLQPPHGDPNGPMPPTLPHHFGAHHHLNHHHPFHHPPSLHHSHHPIHHHSPFPNPAPTTPYTAESARSALIQNATLPPPELNLTYSNVEMGPPANLGSAVASSMHLTNNGDHMSDPTSHYNKMLENSHEILYYSNSSSNPTSDMNNQTTEGFLTSLINDDALQLMDIAMNEGLYTMRMLDNNLTSQNSSGGQPMGAEPNLSAVIPLSGAGGTTTEDRMEASSDSAVSSMGSERVPPIIDPLLSESEWSESEHQHSSPYSVHYSNGKLRGYDYYGKSDSTHRVVVPVPQKKHQMFGKRLLHEQGPMPHHPFSLTSHPIPPYGSSSLHHPSNPPPSLDSLDMKYSCSLDFVRQHDSRIGGPMDVAGSNHTYSLPPTHPDNPIMAARTQRVHPKEKQQKIMKTFNSSEEHISRDEKRARSLGLPLTTDEIINLPMDEFNERLSKHDLSETQLSLIRDIRRRGKNKVAAQNCRKRKIDQINQLAEEVNVIRNRKQNLLREHDNLVSTRNTVQEKFDQLYRLVFQGLRDPEGNPYNPHEFRLIQGQDDNFILVPSSSGSMSGYSNPNNGSMAGSCSSRRGNAGNSKSKEEPKKE